MKLLGIDYGAKRVGIALSDDGGTIAFPKSVISAHDDLVSAIAKICADEKVEAIVIGESKDYAGKENPIMTAVHALKKELEDKGFTVHLEPELMTSMEAQHIQGHNDMNDASAAAIILQSYITKHS